MFERTKNFINIHLKKHSDKQKICVYLDGESSERFERLRQKLRALDDSKLIGLSLKALERKTDKIIKMRIHKKVPELKKEGLSKEAIAEYFNRQDIPVPSERNRWEPDMISELINEEDENRSSH